MTDLSDGFSAFVDLFQLQADANVKQMVALNNQFSALAKQYTDIRRDLERERVAGRHAQARAESLEQQLKAAEECAMRSAFVLVLVDADADAYLFDDKYYTDEPAEGGERAAVDLQAAVRQYLKSIDPGLASLPVMAKAFASGEGLAHLMAKAGIAKSKDSQQYLSRFTCGFSQADDMFDFVLVGKGKDRADHKLTAAFRQFVESPSCQHVLLACCHDNGYVRMLEKYVHNPSVVSKVTMIKTLQTGSEFAGLPFYSTKMDSVFRNRPLVLTPITVGEPEPAMISGGSTPPPTPSQKQANKKPSPPTTYASRAAAVQTIPAPPASDPRPLPIFHENIKDTILVNAAGHRIDMPLPAKSAAVADKFNRKTHGQGKRYCNAYHLRGQCPGDCEYLHEAMTTQEKLVMRHQLRGRKCHDRGGCRDPLCYYGHHCACPGVGQKCNFPVNMHGVDVTSWREVKVAGVRV